MAATFVDEYSIACAAPSIAAAGALAMHPHLCVNLTFTDGEDAAHRSQGLKAYSLHGHAHVGSGTVRLTHDTPLQVGSCIFQPTSPQANPGRASSLMARFDVDIGGVCQMGTEAPCGGAGMSFSFGNVPEVPFGEEGAGDGLIVQLLTHPWYRLVVKYAGTDVAVVEMDSRLRAQVPVQLEVRFLADGLWVRYENRVLLSGVQISAWAPEPTWRFAFGARTGALAHEHDYHRIDNVRIELGTLHTPVGRVALEVGIDGGRFSDSALSYAYISPPDITSVVPASGPRRGSTMVTVSGSSLAGGDSYWCSFNASLVPGTLLSDSLLACATPSTVVEGRALVAVSNNGYDFSRTPLTFTYYNAPMVNSILPVSGPSRGGSYINIRTKIVGMS